MTSRNRRVGSIKTELVNKSREAALAAAQIFNNPNITFKSESYVVLMIIAWTYLLHSYYRKEKIEYRYFDQNGTRKRFHKTKCGAYKYWELERCLNCNNSPIDKNTTNNLLFLIGLRHEIEHQMTTRLDDILSARFQACCLNYNKYIKQFFGKQYGVENHLSFSLQFSTISTEQKELLEENEDLPANIQGYISNFDRALSESEFASQSYSYRLLFVPKTANRKGQADRVINFIKPDSPLANSLNKQYAVIKETEKKKYLPRQIVDLMKNEGFHRFTMHDHTKLWQEKDAKNPAHSYGTLVAGKHWHWYERWVDEIRRHCKANRNSYT